MYATYTLKDGRKITLYYNVNILNVSKTIDIILDEKKVTKKLYRSDNDYFLFEDDERIFLSKFDYYSLEELKERINNGLRVTQDQMQATFMKEPEKVKLLHKGVIYVLDLESKEYPMKSWSYKIPIVTARNSWGRKYNVYYTSHLHALILVGKFKLM